VAALEHASAEAVNRTLAELLRRHGLCGAGDEPHAEALAGGVSSEIWRVDLPSGPVCVKRALPRLRVAQLWEAPVARNRYEYEWFRVAGEAAPGAVPRVLFRDEDAFVMEYLDPAAHPVWKEALRQGRADPAFAARVGRTLAAIHAASAGREDLARRFPTDAIFYAIRLEPYLVATGRAHPDLAQRLDSLVTRTANTKACLVHGDVSPKNILCGPRGPVFLDAECAWYGDPAFDLAFCLNHLLLKCLWVPRSRAAFLECFDELSESYLSNVRFEGVENRTAALLPALLLARVDGKSPVEYLSAESDKEIVRRTARPLIASPVDRLAEVRKAWQESST
jgi:aminoglycoside phosphotransferase (APT) family kinase protein